MHYKFQAVFRARGLAMQPESGDIELYIEPDRIRVTLTREVSPHVAILDRQVAHSHMMLRSIVGNPLQGDFHENLQRTIEDVCVERAREFGRSGFVVIEIDGDVDVHIRDPNQVIDEYRVCFEAYDKQALATRLQPQVSTVLSALRMSGGDEYHFDTVLSGSYLIDDGGRVVHSYSLGGGRADVFVSRVITDEQVEQIRKDLRLLRRDMSLEAVVRLHSYSLNRRVDNFRAFHAAWNALETFVNKVAPTYKRLRSAELADRNLPEGRRAELDSSTRIKKERGDVAGDFSILSSYLAGKERDADVVTFCRLKKVRNDVSHGEEFIEDDLPTTDVQRLFDKYLRNHLRY